MIHNIFVKCLLAAFLAVLAASCVPKIDIDAPAGRNISVAPSADSTTTLTLICNSDIREYIQVMCHFEDRAGISYDVKFDNSALARDTVSFTLLNAEGHVKVAFRGVKLQNTVAPPVFSRSKGVTFDVQAILRTPTDGAKVNWGGLSEYTGLNSGNFWNLTLNALNSGLPGQTPGTSTVRYLDFTIAENEYGKYGISTDFRPGNIFPATE